MNKAEVRSSAKESTDDEIFVKLSLFLKHRFQYFHSRNTRRGHSREDSIFNDFSTEGLTLDAQEASLGIVGLSFGNRKGVALSREVVK